LILLHADKGNDNVWKREEKGGQASKGGNRINYHQIPKKPINKVMGGGALEKGDREKKEKRTRVSGNHSTSTDTRRCKCLQGLSKGKGKKREKIREGSKTKMVKGLMKDQGALSRPE